MITSSHDMLVALRKEVFRGVILYHGPSLIDGAPIVVIANRIVANSDNDKTGAMIQTFIIRQDIKPTEALKTGADASVCGSCIARPANGNFCYVNVGQSVNSVFAAYERGRYAMPGVDYDPAILPELFRDSLFRLGSYGDPAAAPFDVWKHATQFAKARNGYTHQWRVRPEFAALCMASCETPEQYQEAKAMGFRVFRMRLASDPVAPRETVCPASKEAGYKTTCSLCRACGGNSAKAKTDMVIVAHGPKANRYALWRARDVA